jgi:hypothetical protein
MRYMFLVYSVESDDAQATSDEMKDAAHRHHLVMEEAGARGVLLAADPLRPTRTAITVRKRGGKAVTMDGPFAETKEQLGGYYIIDCESLDEAIAWAAKIPTACHGAEGCIEIRPIQEMTIGVGQKSMNQKSI